MKLDTLIHKGRQNMPVVIFIHGLGMDRNFWIAPLETKVFAKNIPMRILAAARPGPCALDRKKRLTVGSIPREINTMWFALMEKGFNLVCWSQSRPVGPIRIAVEELDRIINKVMKLFPNNAIALIGHSRGGLVARKFMEKKVPRIRALITLSTPHHGSSLSRIGKYLTPLSPFLKKLLPKYTHGTISEVMKRINDLIQGEALRELLPDSIFYKNLKDRPSSDITYLSFGGTRTKLLTLYKWKKEENRMLPKTLLTIPDSLIKILPASVVPPELISGKGDFMVTAESAVMPWSDRHFNLRCNHISIIWNKKVIEKSIEVLERI